MILKNANIINEEGIVTTNKNLYIEDGKISRISEEFTPQNEETVDCSGLFVTPGLVNLHTHSPMNIFKGIAEDVSIEDWFNRKIWPYESKMTEEDTYYGALLAIVEMIDNGVTAFADHYFNADRICDAVLETGIRADIAPTLFGISEDFDEQLEKVTGLIEKRGNESSHLRLRFGPHSPYTCSNHALIKILDRAKNIGVGIHIHMSETKIQVEESIEKYGVTPFEMLYNAGGFDVPLIVAHGLWIREGDLKYLNDDTYFAVSPKTYMKLNMGMGKIWELKDRINLCTGTDGAASSNTLNPLEQVRMFALIGKMFNSATEFKLEDMWKMLMRGHKALGFKSGCIKVGYSADLAIWDLKRVNTMPVYNPLASIIYSSNAKNIIHTMVNGKFIKKDERVLVDTEYILKKAYEHSMNIVRRGKGNTKIIF
ncbi:MAG: hypothetical protein K0R09_385 [Clostridiales bacterium]|nr:hypothetical protein [Clostridiales bacterium]